MERSEILTRLLQQKVCSAYTALIFKEVLNYEGTSFRETHV